MTFRLRCIYTGLPSLLPTLKWDLAVVIFFVNFSHVISGILSGVELRSPNISSVFKGRLAWEIDLNATRLRCVFNHFCFSGFFHASQNVT